jgi:alkane 1-monooxygenase
MMVWVAFVLLPLVDYLMPISHFNIPEERVRILEKDKRFLIPLYCVWLADFCVLIWLLHGVSTGTIGATPGMFLLYAFCGAQTGSLNAVVGHELLHRKALVHKILGTLAYSKMLNSHYFIEHVRTHHKKVCTPGDPVTARLGESIFQFYWRAIPEGFMDVWHYEQNRLKQQGTTSIWETLLYNRLITFKIGEGLYLGLVTYIFGVKALAFHLLYSIFIHLQFEAVNYIEHYGL